MGISRSFILYMNADQQKNATVPWTVIGSDAGLSLKPIQSDTLTISIAERWEVVVDFAQYAGQNVTVKNQRDVGADEDYAGTDRLMSKYPLEICIISVSRLRHCIMISPPSVVISKGG